MSKREPIQDKSQPNQAAKSEPESVPTDVPEVAEEAAEVPAAEPESVPTEQHGARIDFNAKDSAVTIHCKYNDRERMAFRLYEERGIAGKGLTLKCDSCGTSIRFEAPDRVPTMTTMCGSTKHYLILWVSID